MYALPISGIQGLDICLRIADSTRQDNRGADPRARRMGAGLLADILRPRRVQQQGYVAVESKTQFSPGPAKMSPYLMRPNIRFFYGR